MSIPVTKELLESGKHSSFLQVRAYVYDRPCTVHGMSVMKHSSGASTELTPPARWRVNGKLKTWKRNPEKFQLPVKHGLYNFGYITEENCHLFVTE